MSHAYGEGVKREAILARVPTVILLCVVTFVTAACGGTGRRASGTAPPPSQPAATIKTGSVPGLGTVLVDARGDTVYMFPPDQHQRVTCTAQCASIWPPVTVSSGAIPTAGAGVRSKLLSTVADPAHGNERVITYDGWPLYTYIGDDRPGEATGQGLDRNGGFWFVLRPSGAPVR